MPRVTLRLKKTRRRRDINHAITTSMLINFTGGYGIYSKVVSHKDGKIAAKNTRRQTSV